MEPPVGTVTLLFSDMEGSTRLVRELGDEWSAVLERCRELCRAAWVGHGGHELETAGDSFFVAFASAADGISAAVDVQRALSEEPWPTPVRVRIGIHTGRPQRHGEGYVGLDVHKAARITAAAHGGQIVISDPTFDSAGGAATVATQDLGPHRLRDISGPIRLHQVTAEGLATDFPPLRSHGGVGDLPAEVSPTFGRDGERGEIADLLAGSTRLLTLTGVGGTGKTRLALTVARDIAARFPDGAFFVPLESVTTSAGMWIAIAERLGIPAGAQLPPTFFDHVAHRRALLVLDNLEQIDGAGEVVSALLEGAMNLAIIATSRRCLQIGGELEHAVPPLLLPTSDDALGVSASGAGQLFLEHARRARPDFSLTDENARDVAHLLKALDGLPLAVEIAAARVRLLSPAALLRRVDAALDFGSNDTSRNARQRTIRAAIAWSYDLLDPDAQNVLDHLAAFDGSASLEALRSVAPLPPDANLLDIADDLISSGLVRVIIDDSDGEPRFHLLETVKRFAADQLRRKGNDRSAISSHAAYFHGAFSGMQRGHEHQARYTAVVDKEFSNIAAVVERLPDGTSSAADVVALLLRACAGAMRHQYVASSAPLALLRLGSPDDHNVEDARLLLILSTSLSRLGRVEDALATYELARDFLGPARDPATAETAIDILDGIVYCLGRIGRAHEAAVVVDEARAIAASGSAGLPYTYDNLLYLDAYNRTKDFALARYHYERVIEQRRRDEGVTDTARDVNNLADLLMKDGRRDDAQRYLADHVEEVIADRAIANQVVVTETFAEVVGEAHPLACARALGTVDAVRLIEGIERTPLDVALDAELVAATRPLVGEQAWQRAFDEGREMELATTLRALASLPPSGHAETR